MPKVKRQSKKKSKLKTRRVKSRKRVSVLDEFESFESFEAKLRMCIYGDSATGKTTFWASFPGKIGIFVTSKETKDELISVAIPEVMEKTHIYVLEETGQLHDIMSKLKKDRAFETIVIDNMTDLQFMILKEQLDLDEEPAQLSWGIADQETWGIVTSKTKEAIRSFYSYNGNALVIAHEREFKPNSQFVESYMGPALTPSAAGFLTRRSNYVVNTFTQPQVEKVKRKRRGKVVKKDGVIQYKEVETGEMDYCLRVKPCMDYLIKFRKPKHVRFKDSFIVDPSYEKVLKLIQQKD